MTRADAIRNTLKVVLDMSTDDQIAMWLLNFTRNHVDDPNQLYSLWCDNQGACAGRDCEDLEDCCSDEEHISCILRFLRQPYSCQDNHEPENL